MTMTAAKTSPKKEHSDCFKLNHSHSMSFNFSNVDELNSKGLLLRLEKEHEKSSLLK